MPEPWKRENNFMKTLTETTTHIKNDKLHKFLLKKLKREIASGQAILHISNKQEQVTDLLSANNIYTQITELSELNKLGIIKTQKAFTYVIADLDMPDLDDFDSFLNRIAPMIIRPGLLIIIASNLATFRNQLAIWFGNNLEDFKRPNRAVTPGFLRTRLLEKGYFVKNRFWQYDEKLLIMADIPHHA